MNRFEYQEQNGDLEITIFSISPLPVKIILWILFLLFFLGMVNMALSMINSNAPIDLALGCAMFGLGFTYLGRILCWNSYGKELLYFRKDAFEFQYDYRLFQSSRERFEYRDFIFQIFTQNDRLVQVEEVEVEEVLDGFQSNKDWKIGYFKLKFDKETFRSELKLKRKQLIELEKIVDQWMEKINQ